MPFWGEFVIVKWVQNVNLKEGNIMDNNIEVKNISLDLIDPNPMNKDIFVVSDIAGLMNSIREHGFMGAIEVYLKPDGRYQISAGHRRYNVMKLLGEKTIPCIVKDLEDESTVTMKLIESNINTRVLSPMELSKAIIAYERALNEEGYSGSVNNKLMQVFNISETKLLKLRSIAKLTDSLQKYAYKVNFPYEAFYDATYFSQDRQKELYELLIEHFKQFPDTELTANLVTQYIQQIKGEIKIEKERIERKKILETIQYEEVGTQETTNVLVPDVADVTPDVQLDIKPKDVQPQIFEQPKFISYEDAMPEQQDVVITSNDRPIINVNVESNITYNPVDFEMELHVNKMLKIIENKNVIISKECKEKMIENMAFIINQLRQMK